MFMKKLSYIIIFSFIISTAYAGEWIQVVNNESMLRIDTQNLESNLWQYLDGVKIYKFHSKETYTYQLDIPAKKSTLSGMLVPMNPGRGFQWFRVGTKNKIIK
jgi:hypothetical protein